jgi:hypothetical protein
MTNWDSALDLKRPQGLKNKTRRNKKQKKHTNTRGEKNFLTSSDL